MPTNIVRRNRRLWAVSKLIGGALAIAVGLVQAQTKTDGPKFEVASIRRCNGASPNGGRGGAYSSPGRLNVSCGTVALLIRQAYVTYANGHLNSAASVPIEDGPGWIDSDYYDVHAKAKDNASREMMSGPMMQGLLEDRFMLKLHRRAAEIPVYALTVAKSGLKLRQLEEGGCRPLDPSKSPVPPAPSRKPPCNDLRIERKMGENGPNITVIAEGLSLDVLSNWLPVMVLDRPVINKTGITGKFSFHLDFAPDETTPRLLSRGGVPGGAPPAASDPTGPSIFTAVQEQLGLKLEPSKGPGEVLVIDHVERPSEN